MVRDVAVVLTSVGGHNNPRCLAFNDAFLYIHVHARSYMKIYVHDTCIHAYIHAYIHVATSKGGGKWCGCAKLPDGSVVFTPSCAIRLARWSSWPSSLILLAGWGSWPSSLSLTDKLRAGVPIVIAIPAAPRVELRRRLWAINFPRYFFS